MIKVVIALGSNIGDRVSQFSHALKSLTTVVQDMRISSLYESDPIYIENQPAFLNAVAVGLTNIGPFELLTFLKTLEVHHGRQLRERNGPRELDLDLVDFRGLCLDSHDLVLPHPRAIDRRFVLEPWHEVEPEARCEPYGLVSQRLSCDEIQAQGVKRIGDAPLPIPRV